MITIDTLEKWLFASAENEHLEFKEAKQQYNTNKLLCYCVALANEGGGYLIFGVTNKLPRQVVGSQAFASPTALNNIKAHILNKLKLRVDITELQHSHGRVLVFEVPSRATGQAFALDGTYLMRAGEDLVGAINQCRTPDKLNRFSGYRRYEESRINQVRFFQLNLYPLCLLSPILGLKVVKSKSIL